MRNVLVTGAKGFIGSNLRASLEQRKDVKILSVDVGTGEDELKETLARADFVFHLAGVNRPKDPAEFKTGNQDFTDVVLRGLEGREEKVPLVLSSSIQAALDNPYGASKRGAEDAVRDYSARTGAKIFLFRLPNVFGKWCRPNYNSVIATWCHNTARGLPIQVNDTSTELYLAYVDDVVEAFLRALDGDAAPAEDGFCRVGVSYKRNLGAIAELLRNFVESRKTLVMPDLSDDFTRKLYGAWVSYLPEKDFSYPLEMRRDERGWLAEFIKSAGFGQIFISRTKPGITRGNHWHHTKVEKFLVVEGLAAVCFRKIDSDEILEYRVSGDELKVVDIPTGYTHSISNVGDKDMITIFWANEIFDQNRPDTYFSGVER